MDTSYLILLLAAISIFLGYCMGFSYRGSALFVKRKARRERRAKRRYFRNLYRNNPTGHLGLNSSSFQKKET